MRNSVIEKTGVSHGLQYVVVVTDMGHRCGYVGVPTSHPLFGVGYNTEHPSLPVAAVEEQPIGKRGVISLLTVNSDLDYLSPGVYFDVHGGITYSEAMHDSYPMFTMEETWWFGFDCAHCDDAPDPDLMSPEFRKVLGELERRCPSPYRVIRTLDYVVKECEHLAEQLVSVR